MVRFNTRAARLKQGDRLKKYLGRTLIIILLIFFGYWYLSTSQLPSLKNSRQLVLQGAPSGYCAEQIQLVIAKVEADKVQLPASVDQTLPVTNCQTVDLQTYLPAGQKFAIFAKTDWALASELRWSDKTQDLIYFIRVGDINDDNIIDQLDQQQINQSLFQENMTGQTHLDINNDQSVTVLDLALVKANQGVGADKPSGSWQKSVAAKK